MLVSFGEEMSEKSVHEMFKFQVSPSTLNFDSFSFLRGSLYLCHCTVLIKFCVLDTTTGLISGPVLNHFNPLSIRGSIPEVEYTLIEAATNNFSESNILGRVGCQPLYKAHFSFGSLAAVKRLDSREPRCERAFEVLCTHPAMLIFIVFSSTPLDSLCS